MTADATFTSWEIQRCPRTISPAQTEHLEAPSADHLLICDFLFHHVTLAVLTFVWMASMGVRCRWCITFIGRRKTWLYHNTEGKKQKKHWQTYQVEKKKHKTRAKKQGIYRNCNYKVDSQCHLVSWGEHVCVVFTGLRSKCKTCQKTLTW